MKFYLYIIILSRKDRPSRGGCVLLAVHDSIPFQHFTLDPSLPSSFIIGWVGLQYPIGLGWPWLELILQILVYIIIIIKIRDTSFVFTFIFV